MLACILVFTFPLLLNPRNEHILSWANYWGFAVPVLVYVAVFYLNFFFLIPKMVTNKKIAGYIVINIVILFVLALLLQLWHKYYFSNLMPAPPERFGSHGIVWQFALRDMIVMALVASLALGIRMTMAWTEAEGEKAKIEAFASETELKNLKSQLNPHFLFNTLNNIYSLMPVDPEKAQESILELSKILRYVLYEDNQDSVPLNSELAFTGNYINLMKLRLTDKVKLTVDIEETSSNLMIAPLIFISLVENAFKHGVSQDEPSFIDISIRLACSTVRCIVRNSNFPKSDNDRSGSGIGIGNLQKRLLLIYPHGHMYSHKVENGVYIADLSINLN
ncbi:MAG: histidine kinase [Bacteroidales bacterium]|nr:histidine kinase [Bacteroidales bacterium]MCI2121238.1 histidine kinase [Bacteroidales bacterium]